MFLPAPVHSGLLGLAFPHQSSAIQGVPAALRNPPGDGPASRRLLQEAGTFCLPLLPTPHQTWGAPASPGKAGRGEDATLR